MELTYLDERKSQCYILVCIKMSVFQIVYVHHMCNSTEQVNQHQVDLKTACSYINLLNTV